MRTAILLFCFLLFACCHGALSPEPPSSGRLEQVAAMEDKDDGCKLYQGIATGDYHVVHIPEITIESDPSRMPDVDVFAKLNTTPLSISRELKEVEGWTDAETDAWATCPIQWVPLASRWPYPSRFGSGNFRTFRVSFGEREVRLWGCSGLRYLIWVTPRG